MEKKNIIELRHMHKEFDGHVILDDISTDIKEGDVIGVIGPSGCGKSTFLFTINLLRKATSGQVFLDGVDLMDEKADLNTMRKKLGMVFQSYNLFGHMTVLENVMNPQITLLGRTRQEAYDKAMDYLTMVGMADRALRYPDALSGGQKQRVAIARTLAMDPEVILLDEPTSALDPTMVGEVEYVIKKLAKQGRTMIIVTHEMRFAREVSNRIFYMDEKGIYEEGPTEKIFTNPDREKTRQFINRIKTLEINIDSQYFDYIDAMRSIVTFGNKFALSHELVQKAQLLFEETCVTKLMPKLQKDQSIRALFEYSEKDAQLILNIFHKGEKLLESGGDSIEEKIINSIAPMIPIKEVISD